jgi:hypothetical protein
MTVNVVKPEVLYNDYNPENEEKEVVEPTEKTSEDFHGGDEVTGSVRDRRFALKPDQPQDTGLENGNGNGDSTGQQNNNDGNTGQQKGDNDIQKHGTRSPGKDIQVTGGYNVTMREVVLQPFTEDGSGTEMRELLVLVGGGKSGGYNTFQAFNVDRNREIERRLYSELYKLIEYLSDEEKQLTPQPGRTTVLNVKRLMMRQYERKPLNAYYEYRSRSQVILILDNSGSMDWLVNELNTFFTVALKRKDVQIFVAPNGHIESYYDYRTKRFEHITHEEAVGRIKRSGLPVIYISDFDGANSAVELSWSNRVYWVCTETRFKFFRSHSWVEYDEDDFKGFFGRAFNAEEMVTVLKEFVKNVHRQRFWYDDHNIEDFREEEYRRSVRNLELPMYPLSTRRDLTHHTGFRDTPLFRGLRFNNLFHPKL